MPPRPPRSKPGRPAKSDRETRSEFVRLRLTVTERDRIEAQADLAGLPLSSYCREVLLGHRVRPAITAIDAAALADLNRVGVNLNQIARQLNARGAIPPSLDTTLAMIRAAIERLAERDE